MTTLAVDPKTGRLVGTYRPPVDDPYGTIPDDFDDDAELVAATRNQSAAAKKAWLTRKRKAAEKAAAESGGGVSPEIQAIRSRIAEVMAAAPTIDVKPPRPLVKRVDGLGLVAREWAEYETALKSGLPTLRSEVADLSVKGDDPEALARAERMLRHAEEQIAVAEENGRAATRALSEAVDAMQAASTAKVPPPEALEEIGAMIRAEVKRREGPMDDLGAELLEKLRGVPFGVEYDNLRHEYAARIDEAWAASGATALDVLADVRPLGPRNGERLTVVDDRDGSTRIDDGLAGRIEAVANEALGKYPSGWIERRWREGAPEMTVGGLPEGTAGVYSDSSFGIVDDVAWPSPMGTAVRGIEVGNFGGIRVAPLGFFGDEDGSVFTQQYGRIVAHELGHSFQDRREGIREAERQYLTARGGAQDIGFAPSYGGSDIKAKYATRAYPVRDINDEPTDEWYPGEVFTVGVENAFYPSGPNGGDERLGSWALGVLAAM